MSAIEDEQSAVQAVRHSNGQQEPVPDYCNISADVERIDAHLIWLQVPLVAPPLKAFPQRNCEYHSALSSTGRMSDAVAAVRSLLRASMMKVGVFDGKVKARRVK